MSQEPGPESQVFCKCLRQLHDFVTLTIADVDAHQQSILNNHSPQSTSGLVPTALMPVAYHIATGKIIALVHVLKLITELEATTEKGP